MVYKGSGEATWRMLTEIDHIMAGEAIEADLVNYQVIQHGNWLSQSLSSVFRCGLWREL